MVDGTQVSTVYTIRSVGWEYNDNWMYKSGFSEVMEAYSVYEKARVVADKLNLAQLRLNLTEGIDQFLRDNSFEHRVLMGNFLKSLGLDLQSNLAVLNDKALLEISDLSGVRFFEVIPLQLDRTSGCTCGDLHETGNMACSWNSADSASADDGPREDCSSGLESKSVQKNKSDRFEDIDL